MRIFKISVLFWGVLLAPPAWGADNAPEQADDQPPPQMKIGGADTRAPGPLTVPPSEIQLPPLGQTPTEDLAFDYHGYFRVPFALSIGKRANPTAEQSSTTFHAPAVVPDYPPGTWLNNNNIPAPWATALFSYGNKTVTGTIGISAFNFTASQDSAMTNNSAAVSLGPVYLHFNLPNFAGTRLRVDWDVGAFSNRYGTSGKYDYGAYGMFLFGATGAIGETLGAEIDAGPTTLRLEHGVGGNYYVDNKYASTLLHHAHAFAAYKQMAKLGLHYMTAWTTDERTPPVQPGDANGRLSVLGVDGRFNGGVFGELYFGVAQAKAIHALHVGPILYTMNSLGGAGMRDNFLGPSCRAAECNGNLSDVNGSVTSILFQYDYSFAALARYLSHYPRAYWTDGPELRLSIFGTLSSVKSDDPDYDGRKKSKFGGELVYSPLPFLSIGGRFDRVNPWDNATDQSFSVLSPKVMFKTSFFSHEVVTLQYSRYFYGGAYPRLSGCGSGKDPKCAGGTTASIDNLVSNTGTPLPGQTINDLYGRTLDPNQTGGSYYDKDVIYLSAAMWW